MTAHTNNQITAERGYIWLSKQNNEWIPYEGPDGGEGWQRVGDDEVRYQERPPGETASGVEENYWSNELGADALTQFLGERDFTQEEDQAIVSRIQDAVDALDSDIDTEAGYVWGRLQHRENKFQQNVGDAPEGAITDLVDSILGRREEEAAQRDALDDLGVLVEDNADMGTRDKLNISDAVQEVHDDTDLTEEELRQDLYEMVEDADMPAEYVLDNAGLNAWKDSKRAEWRSENLTGEDAIEIPEGYDESDITTSHIYDSLSSSSLSPFMVPLNDYDPIPAVAQAMEDEFGDDPNRMYEEIQAFNESLEGVLIPFSQVDSNAPEHLNPQNAEEVGKLEEFTDKTGRSASSMFVAKNVPGKDGDKRDLYITNTNHNRENAFAQDDADAARQILGSNGFQAAGYDSPDSYHVDGEYWVVEGAPGDTADGFHVENDLDNPVQQFAELGASAAVLGAWDIHEGNVFIHEGEFLPVDMDLAGAELHHNADHNSNRYNADINGFMGLFPRMERLFDRMDGGDNTDFQEIKIAVKQRVAEMGEDGAAQKIADAATQSITNRKVRANIKRNVDAIEENDFFEQYPLDTSGVSNTRPPTEFDDFNDFENGQEVEVVVDGETITGEVTGRRSHFMNIEDEDGNFESIEDIGDVVGVVETFDRMSDFEEGQVVEVTEDDREQRSQDFEITETYDDHVEVTAVRDGAILGEGERWNVNDISEITDMIDSGDTSDNPSDVLSDLEDEFADLGGSE